MKSGLIIVDMQEGVLKLKQPVYNESSLIENIKKLTIWARDKKFKVLYTQHENSSFLLHGSPDWKIVRQLEMCDTDSVLYKKHPSIFKETKLLTELKYEDISRLYIVGLISNGCIKEACLDALNNNFEVVLVKDAHSTFYKNASKVIDQINNEIENAGAQIKTTEELLSVADTDKLKGRD